MTTLELELQEWVKVFYEETDESISPDLKEFIDWINEQFDAGRKIKYYWEKPNNVIY